MCSVSAVCSQLKTTLLKKKQSKTVRKFLVIAFNRVTCITKTDRLKWVPMGSAQNACSPVRKLQLFCQSVAVVCSLEVFRCKIHPRCQGSFYEREKLGSKDAPGDVAITWETPAVHVLGNVNIYALRLPWDAIFNIFRCEILREKNSLETRRRAVL